MCELKEEYAESAAAQKIVLVMCPELALAGGWMIRKHYVVIAFMDIVSCH